LVGRAARTFFRDPPVVLQVLTVLVIGLANPTPYNLARPAVYEAAIVGAHGFLLLGMAFAFEAAARAAPRKWLVAAGVAWALAVGCRASVAPAVALLAALTAWCPQRDTDRRNPPRWKRVAAAFVAAGLPLALGAFALLAYNRLRFDSWVEFGRRFQLSWIDAPAGARFVAPNVYSYLLRPPALSCRFPYVFALANMGGRAFPPSYQLPAGYFVYEQVVGLLLAVPSSWTAPIGWIAALFDWWRQRRMTDRAWAVWMAAVAGIAPIAAPLLIASATNRYLGDTVGGVALSGAFGAWILYARLRGEPSYRRPALAGAGVLAGLSVAVGLLLGFYGQYSHFPANNPPLTEQLVRRLSFCGPVVPPPPN
jgi:4-amino-4-deoxy-L-arabinose transferase-like glycosyltransferase